MQVVLLGGAGFIGSHLCDRLLSDGHNVLCIDNFVTGRSSNVEHLKNDSRFELLNLDITRPLEVPGSVDFVLDFASPASPIDFERIPVEILKVGSYGTFNALELARSKGAKFLFASTSEVYGDPEVHPQKEDYWGHVNPIGPRSVYDEAKRFSEAVVMAHRRTLKMDAKLIRIFNTYGPRMRPDDGRVVPSFVEQALLGKDLTVFGDGSQSRSFCYVSDLVEGITRLMHSTELGPVNLGNPREFTMLELAKTVLRLTASKSKVTFRPLPKDDPKQRCPDISKAKAALGWEPKVQLEDGLRLTIPWFAEKVLAANERSSPRAGG